jgi:hypothetical protein
MSDEFPRLQQWYSSQCGRGGALNLIEVLSIFLVWAERSGLDAV